MNLIKPLIIISIIIISVFTYKKNANAFFSKSFGQIVGLGLQSVLPRYNIAVEENSDINHGLLWEVPISYETEPIIHTITYSAYYFFRNEKNLNLAISYSFGLNIIKTNFINLFLNIGSGVFVNGTGIGPIVEARLSFIDPQAYNYSGLFGFFLGAKFERNFSTYKNRYHFIFGFMYSPILNRKDEKLFKL